MNLQVIKFRILSWLRRIFLYSLYFALAFLLLSFGLLQVPSVQKTIITYYTDKISEVSGFKTTFESIYVIWYDRVQIEGLRILDPEQNVMIAAEELFVNFRISFLLDNNNINIDAATLKGADVNLVKLATSDSSRNLNINLLINQFNAGTKKGSGTSSKVNIGEVILNESHFSYNDPWKDSLSPLFDYHHFGLKIEEGLVQNFKVIGDTIQMKINSLNVIDQQTQFEVKKLNTFFRISQRSMEFLNLHLDAGKSHVEDTVIFTYESQLALSDFNRAVNIEASIKNSILDPGDLALFVPQAKKLNNSFKIDSEINGKIESINFNNLKLVSGNTFIAGNLDMDGLPVINETFINLRLRPSDIDINDLQFILPPKAFSQLKPLARFNMSGNFTGFVNDFVANGSFSGNFGKINSDVNLKIDADYPELSRYAGNVEMIDFRIGTYLNDTSFLKSVSLKGNINGKGFTKETADFFLKGSVSKFDTRTYNFTNITTNARFRSQFFNGTFSIDDPNLKFAAEGSIDFRDRNNIVKIQAKLDTAQLHKIGFSKENFFISTELNIDSRGLKVDSLFGKAFFNNTTIIYQDQKLEIDSIDLASSQIDNGRSLLLKSSLADINLHGEYYYSTLFKDLNFLFKEFFLAIKNDKNELDNYYRTKPRSDQEYDAIFNIILRDINPIVKVAGINAAFSRNTRIEGRFRNGITSIFDTYTTIDSITYNGQLFKGNSIEFNGSKIRDSTNVLAMLKVTSDQQHLSEKFITENLLMEVVWNDDHIGVDVDVHQSGKNNYARVEAAVDFLKDSTRIRILPSQLRALDEVWQVNPKNYTLIAKEELSIRNLELLSNGQSILLEGLISNDPSKKLRLDVRNFNLDFLNSISGERFMGIMNGYTEVRDLYHSPYIQNALTIKELTINDFLIGNVTGENIWNQQEKRFDIDFSIDRLNTRTIELQGYYDPSDTEPLHVNANFNKASLKIIEPLLEDIFSNMGGELTGQYSVTGNFIQPNITGTGQISDGQIMINYLKTLYNFSGEFGMTKNQMIFNNFNITDAFNNKGTLDGFIAHRNFNTFRLNLDASFTNLQLLNTTSKDNSLFYGQGYGTGNANLFGPASNLKISANARTDKNTRIFIPMSDSETASKKDFINFISFTDSVDVDDQQQKNPKSTRTASGISMDINLDITPDAYTEIIFDIKSGDIIRGRGNGEIKLQLDTKGEFFMFGSVEFTQGAYNFTLYDIINKEFDIEPGSRISWYGDPYQGTMDINASYRQMASLSPILPYPPDDPIFSNPQIRRKYPTKVILKLEGLMLSPRINFDLQASELPDNIVVEGRPPVRLDFEFEAFKSKADEQELKRQVFSLIILRRFSPPDAFSTSGTLYNSVSELLSNQLSYWLTQVDQNLEIDLDLGTLDQEAFNTFQLRLSYSFLNGRLRVTRDGTFSNQYKPSDNISSIAGDWTVDYLLTPDGKFKVKMYSRSNYNQINSTIGTQNAITTGVSLSHTQNFNQIQDLWHSARERNKKESQAQPLDNEALKEDDNDI